MNRYALLLVLGVFASSTSFVFIRESNEAPVLLAAYRLLLTVIILLPWFVRDYLRYHNGPLLPLFRQAVLPGVVLGLHFISWVIGARLTLGANATLIVSLVPLVMPLFMWMMYRESITRIEIIATGFALFGVGILSYGDLSLSQDHLIGDLVCLLSMILFAFYLALGRRSEAYPSILLYLLPMYFLAGMFCFIIGIFISSPFHPYDSYEIGMIAALAIIPTVIGHSLLNLSMQKFRGQTVSIVNLSQFVFAAVIAYFLYREIPSQEFWIASLVFAASFAMLLRQTNKPEKATTTDSC